MKSNNRGLAKISDDVVEFILTRQFKDLASLTVNSIAREFNINRCYLSHKFKCDKKIPLHHYMLMIKMIRSLFLLEVETDITVEDLSIRMGFSSSDYFTRVFKKMMGTTPGKYKKCLHKAKAQKNV